MARQRRGRTVLEQGELPAERESAALTRELDPSRLSSAEVAQARHRRIAAMRLQEIEGNPLDADEVAMFEMFEREAWTHERRLAYLVARARTRATE
jgi:hypothetical protein